MRTPLPLPRAYSAGGTSCDLQRDPISSTPSRLRPRVSESSLVSPRKLRRAFGRFTILYPQGGVRQKLIMMRCVDRGVRHQCSLSLAMPIKAIAANSCSPIRVDRSIPYINRDPALNIGGSKPERFTQRRLANNFEPTKVLLYCRLLNSYVTCYRSTV